MHKKRAPRTKKEMAQHKAPPGEHYDESGPKGIKGKDKNWHLYGRTFRRKNPLVRVAILTSWDLPRLERAIHSVLGQRVPVPFWVEINAQDEVHQEAAIALCKLLKVDCHVSKSTGRAGVGKQAVFGSFECFTEPFLYLLDGDDWLYPWASQSLERTVSQYPALDILCSPLLDVIQPTFGWQPPIADGAYPCFWGEGLPAMLDNWQRGPGMAEWLYTRRRVITGPGRINLFSKKTTQERTWHPTIGCYEDTLIFMESLALHQQGKMFAACAAIKDVFIYDLVSPESGQKKNDLAKASIELRQAVEEIPLDPRRTSVGELPLIYQDDFCTYQEKIEFARETYPVSPSQPKELKHANH